MPAHDATSGACFAPSEFDVSDVPSPALVIRADRVRANLERLIELAGGDPDRLRPHLKTTKCPEVWRLLMERGLRHFKCATPREARVMLELASELQRPVDLLVAYPHVGPNLRAPARTIHEPARHARQNGCRRQPSALWRQTSKRSVLDGPQRGRLRANVSNSAATRPI